MDKQTRQTIDSKVVISIDEKYTWHEKSLEPLITALYEAGYAGDSTSPFDWMVTDVLPSAHEGYDFLFDVIDRNCVPTSLIILNNEILEDVELNELIKKFEGLNYTQLGEHHEQ